TRFSRDWSSDVCSSDLAMRMQGALGLSRGAGGIDNEGGVVRRRLHRFEGIRTVGHAGGHVQAIVAGSVYTQDVAKRRKIAAQCQIGRASCRERGSGSSG